MQWFICQLHANELPLRHLFAYLDGSTSGPRAFKGEIGRKLAICETLPVCKFEAIPFDLDIENHEQLSTDQKYLYDISTCVSSGNCSKGMANRSPGTLNHSRWVTTANRILRLYVSTPEPSTELLSLVTFVMKVYTRMWFRIKANSSYVNGARNVFETILCSRYLSDKLKTIVDPIIQRNGYFCYSENLLLCMISDSRRNVRELAVRRILKARNNQNDKRRRCFEIPELNFNCLEYYEIIDWQQIKNLTEPPLMEFTEDELWDVVNNPHTLVEKLEIFRYTHKR